MILFAALWTARTASLSTLPFS